MNVSFWQNVIRTEFTEAAYYHIYILFIGSFSRLPPPPVFTRFVKDLGWLHTHIHILNCHYLAASAAEQAQTSQMETAPD